MNRNDRQAWALTAASCATCLAGSLLITIDLVLAHILPRKYTFKLTESSTFLVCAFSFSSAVLLFSAFTEILSNAFDFLQGTRDPKHPLNIMDARTAQVVGVLSMVVGGLFCLCISLIFHHYTPESIVHCGEHSHSVHAQASKSSCGGGGHSDPGDVTSGAPPTERSPLLPCAVSNTAAPDHQHAGHDHDGEHRRPVLAKRASLLDRLLSTEDAIARRPSLNALRVFGGHECTSKDSACALYARPCIGTCGAACDGCPDGVVADTAHPIDFTDVEHTQDHTRAGSLESDGVQPAHHHHIPQAQATMFRIGLQTSVTIALHKLPEGLIMFVSSHADRQLGMVVFLAIGVHNFVEGFTMAYPIYLALGSRWKAIMATAVLLVVSQPVGALIGYLCTRHTDGYGSGGQWLTAPASLGYGICFAMMAGMMSTIAVQSMLPQAIMNDRSNFTLPTIFFLLAIGVVGSSFALELA